jgi:hypothetical protein
MDTNANAADSSAKPAAAGIDTNNQTPFNTPATDSTPFAAAPAPSAFAAATPAAPSNSTPFGVSQDTLQAKSSGGIKLGGKPNPILTTALIAVAALLVGATITFFVMGGMAKINGNTNTNSGSEQEELPEITTVDYIKSVVYVPDTMPTLITITEDNIADFQPFLSSIAVDDEIYVFPAAGVGQPQYTVVYRPSTNFILFFAPEAISANPTAPAEPDTDPNVAS